MSEVEDQGSRIEDQVSEDQGSRIKDQEAAATTAETLKKITDDRLKMIAESIKAVGKMTNSGISFCVVIPGYGVVEDSRLASNCMAPPKGRSLESQLEEVSTNITCQILGLMHALSGGEFETGRIMEIVDKMVDAAKQEFTEGSGSDE